VVVDDSRSDMLDRPGRTAVEGGHRAMPDQLR
jgi:hypothetical protein